MVEKLKRYEYFEDPRLIERSEMIREFTGSYGESDFSSIPNSTEVVRSEGAHSESVIRFSGEGKIDFSRRSLDKKYYANYERRN